MIKSTLVAATLAALFAGSALADDKSKHGDDYRFRGEAQTYRQDDRRDGNYRYDRRWRHFPPSHYRSSSGYRAGYESGWHDGSRSCRFDDRPGRWYRDPRDDYWYFGFEING